MTEEMKYTEKDLGCYFDGAFGFEYNATCIIELAMEHGYVPHYETDIDGDHLNALVSEMDDAEEYLNHYTKRPTNSYWGWIDGDFGLWLHCIVCGEVMALDEGCSYCDGEE